MNKTGLGFFLMVLLLAPRNGIAGDRPHTHDGFFLRLSTGIGVATSQVEDDNNVDNKVQGGGSLGSVAIGAMLTDNLALHAEIFHGALVDPPHYINGTEVGDADGRFTCGGVGPGLTYYFMPSNIYISGAVGITILQAWVGPWRFESEKGFGLDFLVGKEWWVSPNWGLGIAGQFILSSTPSRFDTVQNSFAMGVLFSATYN